MGRFVEVLSFAERLMDKGEYRMANGILRNLYSSVSLSGGEFPVSDKIKLFVSIGRSFYCTGDRKRAMEFMVQAYNLTDETSRSFGDDICTAVICIGMCMTASRKPKKGFAFVENFRLKYKNSMIISEHLDVYVLLALFAGERKKATEAVSWCFRNNELGCYNTYREEILGYFTKYDGKK